MNIKLKKSKIIILIVIILIFIFFILINNLTIFKNKALVINFFSDSNQNNLEVRNNFDFNNNNNNNNNNISIVDYNIYFTNYLNSKSLYNSEDVILDLINNSKEEIYCAIYSVNSKNITNSLILKQKEGLDIFILTDLKQSSNKSSDISYLKSNNINIITNIDPNRYMHHKFCVFDKNTLLIGSANFTTSSIIENNNNFLVFKNNSKLNSFFKNYIVNFNNKNSITSVNSNVSINNNFDYNFYFCDKIDCSNTVLDLFKNSNKSIYCMYYSFTYQPIYYELKSKLDPNLDLDLKIILENNQISKYSVYDKIQNLNSNFIIKDKNPLLMHNKFCIFDNSILLTGSANLSKNAFFNNYESILITNDKFILNNYIDYFNYYWNNWKEY